MTQGIIFSRHNPLISGLCLTISLSSILYANTFNITQADLTNGLVINQPGTWQLQTDATCSSNIAITIASSNVVLDLNKHTINMQNQGSTGISVSGVSNVTIKNGTIFEAATAGIILDNASNVTLQHIITYASQGVGFNIKNGSSAITSFRCIGLNMANGFSVDHTSTAIIFNICHAGKCSNMGFNLECDQYIIEGSHATESKTGFKLAGSNGTIKKSHARGSLESGIYVSGSNISINSCSIEKNAADGITIDAQAQSVIIQNNYIMTSGGYGINAQNPFVVEVIDNRVEKNTLGNYNTVFAN